MKKINYFLELLFPSNIYCICCGAVIDKSRVYGLCDLCVKKVHWLTVRTCEKCGKILGEDYHHSLCIDCREFGHAFDKGYTCAQYNLYERAMIMDLKYRDKSYIGKKIGMIMADRMSFEKISVDIIIPVPIHEKRLEERGYNQAEIMADTVSEKINIPMEKEILKRKMSTVPMKDLNAFERKENVKGAFSMISGAKSRIVGKNVLLIDDIYTTGATGDACSEILKNAGANKVYFLTFAVGGNSGIQNN